MEWSILIPFAFLLLAFILRQPIGLGMIVGSIVYFLVEDLNFSAFANTITSNINNAYVLLAIPLFIFAANIMNSSAITDKIYQFANGLMNGRRGGSAYVNIIASLIFAGMTGSALADASGLGLIEIKQMEKEGYNKPFSCALTAATAVVGPIFPPSIQMVVFAMISGASVGRLFLGGMIPAFIICIMLAIYIFAIAKKRNFPVSPKITLKQFAMETLRALPALLTPVILLFGIYSGIVTPTEAGAIAVLYVLLISVFIYRSLNFKELWSIVLKTCITTGQIFLIVIGAYIFSYIINLEQTASIIQTFAQSLSLNRVTFLIFVNILFLLLGMIVDINVSTLVVLPLILPLVKYFQIDMIHFGVMITLNQMIGLVTPPFGMLLFIVSGIGNCSLKSIIKESLPMIAMLILALIAITVYPPFITFFTQFVR